MDSLSPCKIEGHRHRLYQESWPNMVQRDALRVEILGFLFLEAKSWKPVEPNTHGIHVWYIYGNIYHQYTPNVSIYIYIPAPWILWDMTQVHMMIFLLMAVLLFQALVERLTNRRVAHHMLSGDDEKRPIVASVTGRRSIDQNIPSGKLTKNYGKSPFLMGKSTISMAIFPVAMLVHQRVSTLLFGTFLGRHMGLDLKMLGSYSQ